MTEATLHKLVVEACSKFPHRSAAIYDDGRHGVDVYTYRQVQETANTITSLLSSHSKCGEIIALYVEPCISLPAFILGILQLPAAYGPIDPHAPISINEYFIKEVGISIICVQSCLLEHFANSLGQSFDWELCPNVDQELISSCGLVTVRLGTTEHNKQYRCDGDGDGEGQFSSLVYALHTSGTTGRPKIVRVPHCCIVPNILDLRLIFSITEEDVVFMASPLTFDPSVVEMFMTWSQGATLLIVPTKLKMAPSSLAQVLRRNHVTVVQATPSLISRFSTSTLQQELLGASSTLRLLAFGGESCPTPSTIACWRGAGNRTEFFNLYGITEVSSWASSFKIPEEWIENRLDHHIPLGGALKDTILQVRDGSGQELKSGIGEVFIGGYKRICFLDNEEPRMSSDQLVMRATGDMVEVTKRGLFFLGRQDDQVKRHGKRISLLHIKQVIETCPEVESCAIIHTDGRLITFYTPTIKDHISTPASVEQSDLENKIIRNPVSSLVFPSTSSTLSYALPSLDVGISESSFEMAGQASGKLAAARKRSIRMLKDLSSNHLEDLPSLYWDDKPSTNVSEIGPGDLQISNSVPEVIEASLHSDGSMTSLGGVLQTPRSIVDYLRGVLPSHAVPDRFVALQELPITRHGKVDTGALSELLGKLEASEEERRAKLSIKCHLSVGGWREILVREWKNCLFLTESDAIGDCDSFVALGGDSFQALCLVESLEAALGFLLPDLMDVLLHQTFFNVCQTISQHLQQIKCQSELENHQDIENRSFNSEHLIQSSGTESHQENATYSEAVLVNKNTHNVFVPSVGKDIVQREGQLAGISTQITSGSFEDCDTSMIFSKFPNDENVKVDSTTESRKPDDDVPPYQGLKRKLQTIDPWDDASLKKTLSIGPETALPVSSASVKSQADIPRKCAVSVMRGTQLLHHNCFRKRMPLEDSRVCSEPSVEQSQCSLKEEKVCIEEHWKVDTGKCVDASPLIVCTSSSQTVYIGSHSHLFLAITMETGNVLWEAVLGDRVESSACLSPCGNLVIVGCYDHFVYCLSASTGDIFWKYETGDVVKCSPVSDLMNGLVYIGSHDQHIVALQVQEEKYKTAWRSHCGGGSVFASPCIHHDTGTLVAATLRGNVISFNKESGEKKWSFPCPKPVFSSPVAMDDGILVGCVDGIMYCLSHAGIQLWTCTVGGSIFSSPCIPTLSLLCQLLSNDGQPSRRMVVFGSHDGSVTCLDPFTGQQDWSSKLSAFPVYSTPFVFTRDGCRRVAVASMDGHVYILDLLTGKILAEIALPGEVFSSPVVIEGKHLLVGCRNDFVYCLDLKGTDAGT